MDIENEIWIDIVGYEDMYQISNLGRVKSLSRIHSNGINTHYTTKEKIRKHRVNIQRNGYCEISLFKNNKEKRYKIHRLVLIAFSNNIENKPEVNHIDGNKENNRLDNLEWVTSIENSKHAWDNKLCNSNHRKVKIKCIQTNEIFDSVVSASEKMNIYRSDIFKNLKGKKNHIKGYSFTRI